MTVELFSTSNPSTEPSSEPVKNEAKSPKTKTKGDVPQWLTIAEVVNIEDVSEFAIYKRIRTGAYITNQVKGKGGKGGKKTMIRFDSLSIESQAKFICQCSGTPFSTSYIKEEKKPLPDFKVLESLPDYNKDVTCQRLGIISRFDLFQRANAELSDRQARITFCEIWNKEHPDQSISAQTLWRWKKSFAEGNVSAVAAGYGNRAGQTQLTRGDKANLKALFCRPNITAAAAFRDWIESVKHTRKNLPSYQTALRFIKSLPPIETDYFRISSEKWWDKYSKHLVRDYTTIPGSNIIICSDHKLIDNFIRHPKNGKPVRPWLTSWIDLRSRYLTGWIISLNPNQDTINAALRQSIMAYGAPKFCLIDGGADYQSHAFMNGQPSNKQRFNNHEDELLFLLMVGLYKALGIDVITSIPRHPQSKPLERFHGTMDEWSASIPAYCGRKSEERPDQCQKDIDSNRLYTLEQITQSFYSWVVDDYHNRSHKGQGMDNKSPATVFFETYSERRRVEERDLDILMLRRELRNIRRNGIEIHNGWYDHPDLDSLRNNGKKYVIGTDPKDLTAVSVFDESGRKICVAGRDDEAGWLDKFNREDFIQVQRENKRRKQAIKDARQAEHDLVEAPTLGQRIAMNMGNKPIPPTPSAPVIRPVRPELKKVANGPSIDDLEDMPIKKPSNEMTWEDLVED